VAVDRRQLGRGRRGDPAEQLGHGRGADDRSQRGLGDPAAVGQQDDVRREDVEQALQVAGVDRPLERIEHVPGLGRGRAPARLARGDVRPRPVGDLADGGGTLADGLGDLVVIQVEDLAQHEHRPLGRVKRLQHEQHRHRDAVGQFDVGGHVGRGQQRFGQPGADVGLLAAADRPQPGQRLAGGDPDQVGALVTDRVEVDAGPAQPGLLQDVFGVSGRAEHLVGDGEQQVPVGDERLGGGVHAVVAHSFSPALVRPGRVTAVSTHKTPLPAVV
jgi:hypothetical protein